MTHNMESRPSPDEIVKQVEHLVRETPAEVTARMKQRLEERRRTPDISAFSELMNKRLG